MAFAIRIHKKIGKNSSCFLAGDVGGTNTKLGLFSAGKLHELVLCFNFRSQKLTGLHEAINEALAYLEKNLSIKVTRACFAVAGVISPSKDFAQLTNVRWNVSKEDLLRKTSLKQIMLLNDFEALGHGINIIGKKDIAMIRNAAKVKSAPVLVVGAGTGLGKTMLVFDENKRCYIPIRSEAGHSDFAAQNKNELELVEFIKSHKRIGVVSYEEILSGRGLENMYHFFRGKFKATKYAKEIDKSKNKPELISKCRKVDAACKASFETFSLVLARFARNFALDSIALGGVYIAGGIAPKNMDIFNKKFVKEFENSHKLSSLLRKMPLYLITNEDAGLLGAGYAGKYF